MADLKGAKVQGRGGCCCRRPGQCMLPTQEHSKMYNLLPGGGGGGGGACGGSRGWLLLGRHAVVVMVMLGARLGVVVEVDYARGAFHPPRKFHFVWVQPIAHSPQRLDDSAVSQWLVESGFAG
jgi:hypothetical protein